MKKKWHYQIVTLLCLSLGATAVLVPLTKAMRNKTTPQQHANHNLVSPLENMNDDSQLPATRGVIISEFSLRLDSLKTLIATNPEQSKHEMAKLLVAANYNELWECLYFLSNLATEDNVMQVRQMVDLVVQKCDEFIATSQDAQLREQLKNSVDETLHDIKNKIVLRKITQAIQRDQAS